MPPRSTRRSAATVRQVLAVDDENIPLTPTGKVRKVVLRQRHLEGMAAP